MFEDSFWWPFELSAPEEQACAAFFERMRQERPRLDAALAHTSSNLLAHAMGRHIREIIERDSLPHYGHIINGWGDAHLQGRRLMEGLERFVHRDTQGRPFILQRDAEGEFHPWQSFAYSLMAGVPPDRPLPGVGSSLREVALHSRQLNVDEGTELGHLLYALAALEPEPSPRPFTMNAAVCDVHQLMERAVDAHWHGGFAVCRKVHLTEGLCAAAARVRGLESWREDAQGFLQGQLDILYLLGAILEQVDTLAARGARAERGTLLHQLRHTLYVDELLENHFYYAGHLIELACLAHLDGYAVAPEHWSAMAFIVERLNRTLPRYLPHVVFGEHFLPFGHYRRALTLLLEVEQARAGGPPVDLARFTVDFENLPPLPEGLSLEPSGPSPVQEGLYLLARPSPGGRPAFEAIISHYARQARPGLEPRGRFPHFRRIGPPSWPRALHYELLDEAEHLCAEVHLESEPVRALGPLLRSLAEPVAHRLPEHRVEWDGDWSHKRGRLRVVFHPDASSEAVLQGLHTLIDATFPTLDAEARRLGIPVNDMPALHAAAARSGRAG